MKIHNLRVSKRKSVPLSGKSIHRVKGGSFLGAGMCGGSFMGAGNLETMRKELKKLSLSKPKKKFIEF